MLTIICVSPSERLLQGVLGILVVKHSMKYTNMTFPMLMSYISYISAGEVSEAYNYILY